MNEQIGTIILAVGVVLAVVGSLWFVVRAFGTSIGWGIAVLVPVIGPIAFLVAHPRRGQLPFALILLGAIVGFSPIVLNAILGEKQAAVPFVTEKQIVTRGAKDTKYDEMLAKTTVESASFNSADFTDDLAARLDAFANLKRLDLADSGITDATLVVLAKLPALEEIVLSRCTQLTDDGIKTFLANAKTLKKIDARGNAEKPMQVKIETLRDWRKAGADRVTNPK
jgi:hypothetical protein